MSSLSITLRLIGILLALTLTVSAASPRRTSPPPNIVFILADDLGYGELGSYGQTLIQTPRLDQMAAEGMRFTQFYAGNTVCAPSRSVLMTGLHMGHTRVRGNARAPHLDSQTLQAEDTTIAQLLKQRGYATGLVGKWGLGELGSPGEPSRQGFDYHFGFINQTHAHNHYPNFVWRNGQRVDLANDLVRVGDVDGAGYSEKRITYIDDVFTQEAVDFITRHQKAPFFLFLALVTPHANNERSRALGDGNEVPDQGIYAEKPWADSAKNHAAMVTRMDRDVGTVLDHLKALGLDENTLVLFSSDNGAHREGGPNYDPSFFKVSGPFSGLKRSLTEGGIRVPLIARWPGKIKPASTSLHVGYFGDMMATWSELAGVSKLPAHDGISFVPELTGKGKQGAHDYLYWEFYEKGVSQAVLLDGRWKALRLSSPTAAIQLYDVPADPSEKNDVATRYPDVVKRAASLFSSARKDNTHWKLGTAPTP